MEGQAVKENPRVKIDGKWINPLKVFKRVNGTWVEQTGDDKVNWFDKSKTYVRKK